MLSPLRCFHAADDVAVCLRHAALLMFRRRLLTMPCFRDISSRLQRFSCRRFHFAVFARCAAAIR